MFLSPLLTTSWSRFLICQRPKGEREIEIGRERAISSSLFAVEVICILSLLVSNGVWSKNAFELTLWMCRILEPFSCIQI